MDDNNRRALKASLYRDSTCHSYLLQSNFVLNVILFVKGLLLFGFALYLFFSPVKTIDNDFVIAVAAVMLLTGFIIMSTGVIGFAVSKVQVNRNIEGWRGRDFQTIRKIMSITYFVLLILIFIGELYGLLYVLSTKASFDRTYSAYSNDPTIELQGDEWFLKKKFDRIFFTAETVCNSAVFSRFWTIVDNRCPSGMLSSNCRFCPNYVLYVCAVDQTACSESSSQNNNTCPYILCRSGVLDFVKEQMQPLVHFVVAVCLFQGLLLIQSAAIACYRKRDDHETILEKSGTLAAARNRV